LLPVLLLHFAAGALKRSPPAPPPWPPAPRSYLLERGDLLLFVEDEEQEKQPLSMQEAYTLMVRGGPLPMALACCP
jgi:hypothetical protein